MLCATGSAGRRRCSRKGSIQCSLSAIPPEGYSEVIFNVKLKGVRIRLQAASCGTLKNRECEVPRLVEAIRQSTEWLVWGETHDSSLFELFCEHSILAGMVGSLRSRKTPSAVKLQVLQTLSMLVQNVQRETSMIYLLSGGRLSALFDGAPELDEEMLAYFVTLLKGIAMRLNAETALLCLMAEKADAASGYPQGTCGPDQYLSGRHLRMPIFERSVQLVSHRDSMVQTSARTAVLRILSINQVAVRAAVQVAATEMLAPRLSDVASMVFGPFMAASEAHENMQELLDYVADLFDLGISELSESLTDQGFCLQEDGEVSIHGPLVIVDQAENHPAVRVFDQPKHDAQLLCEIPNGECIHAVDRQGDFVLVSWQNVDGWVGWKNIRPQQRLGLEESF